MTETAAKWKINGLRRKTGQEGTVEVEFARPDHDVRRRRRRRSAGGFR
ncbi:MULTISPECIES: hypothetical protein [Actinoalloteichus]|nr:MULTISPECIES: hypothetical protein [Actinoalloteichus]